MKRLVLNDVGPVIELAALQRIGTYLGQPLRWGSVDEAADYLLSISSSFGPHSREQWLALTGPQLVADGDGFKSHYDPAIAIPVRATTRENCGKCHFDGGGGPPGGGVGRRSGGHGHALIPW